MELCKMKQEEGENPRALAREEIEAAAIASARPIVDNKDEAVQLAFYQRMYEWAEKKPPKKRSIFDLYLHVNIDRIVRANKQKLDEKGIIYEYDDLPDAYSGESNATSDDEED